MKKFKILTALITTLVIVMTFCLPVFAADSFTIKITKKDDAAHTYEAYQIFTGTVGGEDILNNVQWGSSIAEANQAGFLTGIQALTFGTATPFSACTSAADVATVLCEADDADKEALAATFAAYIGRSDLVAATPTASVDIAADETDGTMTVSSPGYYFIRDKENTLEGSTGAYTEFILKVCGDVNLDAKSDVPTLDKNILKDTAEGTEKLDADTVSIGDYVKYQLDSVVPNMDGYNRYYYNIHDTMSTGLTFCNNDETHPLTITIGTNTLEVDTDYTVTSTTDDKGKTKLTIVLKDFYNNYKDAAGQAITVTYYALVNEKASLTTDAANMNDAYLVFSNDPNYDYEGNKNPDTPDTPPSGGTPTTPTGKTPESKTVVYTTGIQVIKLDKNTKNLLKGATFELAGTGVKTTLTFTMKFTENAAGTFYQLANDQGVGTEEYTQLEPTDATLANYVRENNAAVKYIAQLDSYTKNTSTDTELVLDMTETGILTVYGLNAGEYYLTEETAPRGYNKLEDQKITIVIKGKPSLEKCEWSATVDGKTVEFNKEDNYLPITIENSKGTVLPATGGIGTTILYVVGSILMIGAGVVLVTKKRVEMKKK